ncbi:MAG TPA: hypothetical protein ENK15_01990 [Thermopetrobacter sp.]|nr:hypothetical protein [Thermopetrobacter sp.]
MDGSFRRSCWRLERTAALAALTLALAACGAQLRDAPPVLGPPDETLKKAGRDAGEIDPTILREAEAQRPPPVVAKQPAAQRARPAPERKNRPVERIGSVMVAKVAGAPGRGNRELRTALQAELLRAGWPLRARARADTMRISGKVTMGKPAAGRQKVAIAWTVRSPKGRLMGVVRQANVVPAGSLDNGFGPAAAAVARHAAAGIKRLVAQLKR